MELSLLIYPDSCRLEVSPEINVTIVNLYIALRFLCIISQQVA